MMCEFAGARYDPKVFDSNVTEDWPTYKLELQKINPLANLPFIIDVSTDPPPLLLPDFPAFLKIACVVTGWHCHHTEQRLHGVSG